MFVLSDERDWAWELQTLDYMCCHVLLLLSTLLDLESFFRSDFFSRKNFEEKHTVFGVNCHERPLQDMLLLPGRNIEAAVSTTSFISFTENSSAWWLMATVDASKNCFEDLATQIHQ